MKAAGYVRNIDSVGRIGIPQGVRKQLGWDFGTPLEVYVGENQVVFKRYVRGCSLCNSMEDIKEVGNVLLCIKCREVISVGMK